MCSRWFSTPYSVLPTDIVRSKQAITKDRMIRVDSCYTYDAGAGGLEPRHEFLDARPLIAPDRLLTT